MFIFVSLIIRISPFHIDTDMFMTNIHLFVSWSIHSDTCNSHKSTPTPQPRLTHTTQLGLPSSHRAKGHNYPGCLWHCCLRVRRESCSPLHLFFLPFCTRHTHKVNNSAMRVCLNSSSCMAIFTQQKIHSLLILVLRYTLFQIFNTTK